ncbi:MAG: hypothetical protein QGH15_23610, partial [Kiritimatiellia bacterium]|nr:hypothetical protein [Kiritimatiellia bacterium]
PARPRRGGQRALICLIAPDVVSCNLDRVLLVPVCVSVERSGATLQRRHRCEFDRRDRYVHQEVWVRGYVHEVVIGCGAEIIARHRRSYDREDLIFDPIHYLPLRKPTLKDRRQPGQWRAPEQIRGNS